MGFWDSFKEIASAFNEKMQDKAEEIRRERDDLERKASQGDHDAMYKWARILHNRGDKEEAKRLIVAAAREGHGPSRTLIERSRKQRDE